MELLPEEVIVNICQNMDISELRNFIRTSKTHYRICDEILEDKFEEAIEILIEESKRVYPYILKLEPLENVFGLRYIKKYSTFMIREEANVVKQFTLKKLGWYEIPIEKYNIWIETDNNQTRLVLLDLLTNGYINGKFSLD